MSDTGENNEKVISFRGKEFTIIEHLTIAENIKLKANRNSLCLGQYAEMISSPIPDEADAGAFAHAVAEIDARVIKAPDGWEGASDMTDEDFVEELYKEIARACGLVFPSDTKGKFSETEGNKDDSSEESDSELEEEVVQGEIQSESEESGISENDRQRD